MKAIDLPLPKYYAYLAGSAAGWRAMYMARARQEEYPEVKKMHVDWARAENRASIKYMKLARETA